MALDVIAKESSADTARSSGVRWWNKRFVPPLVALLITLAVWWPLTIPLRGFLPTPLEVIEAFFAAWVNPEFYGHLGATLRRVAIGTVTAFFTGSFVGILMGRSKSFEAFALPWVMMALALPGPVIILFTILLLGLEEITLLVALWVAVTPFVTNIVYEGAKSLDPDLFDMSVVYRWASFQRFRHLIMPQMAPSLFSGVRFGFAFSWKIVVIIEALSLPNGIGAQIEFFFRLLRTDKVIAWTLSFTLIMSLVDVLIFRPTKRRVFAWRKEAAL